MQYDEYYLFKCLTLLTYTVVSYDQDASFVFLLELACAIRFVVGDGAFTCTGSGSKGSVLGLVQCR